MRRPIAGGTRRSFACVRAASARHVRLTPAVAVGLGLSLTLGACGKPDVNSLTDTTWQVNAIYTASNTLGALPPDAVGSAVLSFGPSWFKASTPCGALNGTVQFTTGGSVVPVKKADHATFSETELSTESLHCTPGQQLVHDQPAELLRGEFALSRRGPQEFTLTAVRSEIDPPVLRLVAY